MLPSYRLGALLGFPIRINLSFLLMLAVVWLAVGGRAGVMITSIAFVSVLLHELGHAVVARRRGVAIQEIEFHFFGGAAKMLGLPRTPRDEILIAAAGPAVSFVLAGAAWLLGAITGTGFFVFFGLVNLVIGAFNLLPALPMDGGRILRAALAQRMGFLPATKLAIRIARWLALGLAVVGLVAGHFMLIPLAVVLWVMGLMELAVAHVRGYGGYPPDEIQNLWTRLQQGPFGFRSPGPEEDRDGDVEYIPPGGHIDKRPETPPQGPTRPGSYRVFVIRP